LNVTAKKAHFKSLQWRRGHLQSITDDVPSSPLVREIMSVRDNLPPSLLCILDKMPPLLEVHVITVVRENPLVRDDVPLLLLCIVDDMPSFTCSS